MTEQECVEVFKELLDVPCEMLIKYDSVATEEQKKALVKIRVAEDMAIKALEEIQQYRALGTVEELRVARDKQEEFCEWEYDEVEEQWQTDCGVLFTIHDSDREITNYCPCCGKRIKVRCEDDNH